MNLLLGLWFKREDKRPKKRRARRWYLDAVAALYKDAGAGSKSERDEAYKNAMKAVYEKYPDDEIKLFYGLSILRHDQRRHTRIDRQAVAAKLFEEVYAKNLSTLVPCTT